VQLVPFGRGPSHKPAVHTCELHSFPAAHGDPPGFGLWQLPFKQSLELHCALSTQDEPLGSGLTHEPE
jgi:hypothetical protein